MRPRRTVCGFGCVSTAGRRPETRTSTKPRLGRGLSTTDSFCGLEFRGGRCGLDTTDDCGLEFSRGLDVGPRLGRAGPRFGRGQDRRAPAPVGPRGAIAAAARAHTLNPIHYWGPTSAPPVSGAPKTRARSRRARAMAGLAPAGAVGARELLAMLVSRLVN